MNASLLSLLAVAGLAIAGPAQVACPAPAQPAPCAALIPGTPLPWSNPAAPIVVDLGPTQVVEIHILGHSESRGYAPFLQALLDQAPPLAGVTFAVQNHWIAGHEAWRGATPGERGYQAITRLLQNRRHPALVLGLFSNNRTFPIQTPSTSDPNFAKFVADLQAIANRLHAGGNGVAMTYLSAHRYKPSNFLPSYYESCAVGELMSAAGHAGRTHLKPGPEQHDLHWCCFPTCYDPDLSHTNQQGDELMALTWYQFLVRELTGCAAVPFGDGVAGAGGATPVLGPSGGFPKLGNGLYAVQTTEARAGAPLAYVLGSTKLPGPLLVQPVVMVSAAADASGQHTLGLPIPTTPELHGGTALVQTLVLDPAAPLGIASTPGARAAPLPVSRGVPASRGAAPISAGRRPFFLLSTKILQTGDGLTRTRVTAGELDRLALLLDRRIDVAVAEQRQRVGVDVVPVAPVGALVAGLGDREGHVVVLLVVALFGQKLPGKGVERLWVALDLVVDLPGERARDIVMAILDEHLEALAHSFVQPPRAAFHRRDPTAVHVLLDEPRHHRPHVGDPGDAAGTQPGDGRSAADRSSPRFRSTSARTAPSRDARADS